MQTTDISVPAGISRVDVRLLPFWVERPAVWFAQAEAQFTLASISSEQNKFCYMILQLNQHYASEVEDIIISPPEQDPYSILKTELVTPFISARGPNRDHRLQGFQYCFP
jgi:hypothetical protein